MSRLNRLAVLPLVAAALSLSTGCSKMGGGGGLGTLGAVSQLAQFGGLLNNNNQQQQAELAAQEQRQQGTQESGGQ